MLHKLFARRSVIAVVSCMGLALLLGSSGCGSTKPVVKKVDHITIQTPDPQGLFAFFTETLGLPVAWPLATYPGFTTGGAFAGNVNIESLNMGQPGKAAPADASIYGIVFEPYPLTEATSELKARGADPGKPEPMKGMVEGKPVTLYTTVNINSLCTDNYIVYLCEYAPETREMMKGKSASESGPLGGIGLESVREIDVTATDVNATRAEWKKALAPAQMSSDGVMTIGSGPAVRISKGGSDRIVGLVFQVASLQKAQEFLKGKDLLAESTGKQARIDPSKAQGLNIVLVEK